MVGFIAVSSYYMLLVTICLFVVYAWLETEIIYHTLFLMGDVVLIKMGVLIQKNMVNSDQVSCHRFCICQGGYSHWLGWGLVATITWATVHFGGHLGDSEMKVTLLKLAINTT